MATTLLVADVATAGKAWKPYVDVVMSEQEDALAAAAAGFASIQPPTVEADDVRAELLALLRRAQDHVAAVRIGAPDLAAGDLRGPHDGLTLRLARPRVDEAVGEVELRGHGDPSRGPSRSPV